MIGIKFIGSDDNDPELGDLKDKLLSHIAGKMSRDSAVHKATAEVIKKTEDYADDWEKRKGGEDRHPIDVLMIATIAHLTALRELHIEMAAKAHKAGRDEASRLLLQDIGALNAALLIINDL